MLQSKPVGGSTIGNGSNDGAGVGSTYNQTHLGNFWAGNSKDTIRAIQSRAHAISAVFAKLCKWVRFSIHTLDNTMYSEVSNKQEEWDKQARRKFTHRKEVKNAEN